MAARKEAWATARHLVVSEGLTYQEAATRTGLSFSSVAKRAAAEKWQADQQVAAPFLATMMALKHRIGQQIAQDAADGKDVSQATFALIQLERVYPEHRYNKAADPAAKLALAAEILPLFISALAEIDPNLVTAIEPHVGTIADYLEARLAVA